MKIPDLSGIFYVMPSISLSSFIISALLLSLGSQRGSLTSASHRPRIAMANFLIGEGESQKSAAFQAGFSDYACFYRLNKKYKNDMKK